MQTSDASVIAQAPVPTDGLGRGAGPGAGGGVGGGRGGGGGGGRGGRSGGQFAGADSATGAAPPVVADGLQTVSERVDGIEWAVLPREAAAARSGMALYGIAGLTPSRTMVNADASRVRTVYTVDAAEIVLLQEKQPVAPAANQGRLTFNVAPAAALTAEAPIADVTQRRESSATVWSSVRGEVILTIQGGDAAALGARVRLD